MRIKTSFGIGLIRLRLQPVLIVLAKDKRLQIYKSLSIHQKSKIVDRCS